MSDTFLIKNKISNNLYKIDEKYKLDNNIQNSDYLLEKINGEKSKRYQIIDIDNDNNCSLSGEDDYLINTNLSILFDTNILISREGDDSSEIINNLFKQLSYLKINNFYVLNDTKQEIENFRVNSDEKKKYKNSLIKKIYIYKDINVEQCEIDNDTLFNELLKKERKEKNDLIDNKFLYLIWKNKIDVLITQDKQIIRKSKLLGINNRVLNSETFLSQLLNTKTEEIPNNEIKLFKIEFVKLSDIDYKDPFFDSFRKYYKDFNEWFIKKQKEGCSAYVLKDENKKIKSFLFLKEEQKEEIDEKIWKQIYNKYSYKNKILKISSFKSIADVKMGERFLYFTFQNAQEKKSDLIYTTFFYDPNNIEIEKYKKLITEWGFEKLDGLNSNNETIYVKNMKEYNVNKEPIYNYPLEKPNYNVFLLPIKYEYHLDLFVDLKTKRDNVYDFLTNKNYKYVIKKWYICNPYPLITNNLYKNGDKILIYRMGKEFTYKKYTSSITGEAILNNVKIIDKKDINWDDIKNKSLYDEEKIKKEYGQLEQIAVIELLFLRKYKKPVILDYLKNKYSIDNQRIFSFIDKEKYNQIINDMEKNEL